MKEFFIEKEPFPLDDARLGSFRFESRDELIQGYKSVFGGALGELVLEDIIDMCMVFANPLTGGDADNYANVGKQQVGKYILSIINSELQEAKK